MVSVAGVAPILVHVARTGETWQVSGVGPYPRASSAAWFRERHGGQIPPGLARTVVPAAPDSWLTALERWGTRAFAGVAPAAPGRGTARSVRAPGVGPSPRAASAAWFRERHGGQIPPGLARTVVPAAPDSWLTALERWGTMSFADVATAATEHAERGFPVSIFS